MLCLMLFLHYTEVKPARLSFCRMASGTQTDRLISLLPYEHLFSSALPLPHAAPPPELAHPDPYSLLDKYIEAAIHSKDKSGRKGK